MVIPIPDHIEILNPQTVMSATNKQILRMIFSPLFELKGNTPKPKIIESWVYNPIDNKYTFKIKENIYFHDGKKLNSEDVIFSIYQWSKDSSLDSHLLTCIEGVEDYQEKRSNTIKGVIQISQSEFSLKTKNNSTDLIQLLTMPRFVILPKNFNEKAKDIFFQLPIGTGPFKYKYSDKEQASFEQFEKYFSNHSKLKKITFKRMNYRQSLDQFNHNLLDNLFFFSVGDVNEVTRKDKIIEVLPSTSTVAIVIPLNNKYSVSKINRYKFAQIVYQNLKDLSSCFKDISIKSNIFPEGIIQNDLSSIEKADTFENGIVNFNEQRQFSIYVTSDLWTNCFDSQKKNISQKNIKLISGELSDLFEKFKKNELHYFIEEFTIKNADPDSVLQYFEPGGGEYLLAKEIPTLKNLFNKLHSSPNREIQWQVINEIVRYLKKERLVLPLYHPKNNRVYSDQIIFEGVRGIYRNTIDWENIGYRK
jgi:ABC-type transport system substrate-binding protein